jgi:hypothetical protein
MFTAIIPPLILFGAHLACLVLYQAQTETAPSPSARSPHEERETLSRPTGGIGYAPSLS